MGENFSGYSGIRMDNDQLYTARGNRMYRYTGMGESLHLAEIRELYMYSPVLMEDLDMTASDLVIRNIQQVEHLGVVLAGVINSAEIPASIVHWICLLSEEGDVLWYRAETPYTTGTWAESTVDFVITGEAPESERKNDDASGSDMMK
jgi:hypothetical protein